MTIPFRLAGPLGGIVNLLSSRHKSRIDGEVKYGADWSKQNEGKGELLFEAVLSLSLSLGLWTSSFSSPPRPPPAFPTHPFNATSKHPLLLLLLLLLQSDFVTR